MIPPRQFCRLTEQRGRKHSNTLAQKQRPQRLGQKTNRGCRAALEQAASSPSNVRNPLSREWSVPLSSAYGINGSNRKNEAPKSAGTIGRAKAPSPSNQVPSSKPGCFHAVLGSTPSWL